jgi:hypothetical protein
MIRLQWILAGAGILGCLVYVLLAGSQYPAPPSPVPSPVPDISSCEVPDDVSPDVPASQPYAQRPFFDDYSWRAFAALICAAKPGARGVADSKLGREGQEPRVFETFKSAWEIFHRGKVLQDFNRYEAREYNPCGNQAKDGDLVLASATKFFDVQQADNQGHRFAALPARNQTYTRYLAQYNEPSFNEMVDAQRGLNRPVKFPDRSVNIKSAWIEMKDLDRSHFYTRWAWIPRSHGQCERVEVGLVGLHIVQKTRSRQNWIWSTFEHVENAPDFTFQCKPGQPKFTFNRGDCKNMPDRPPNGKNIPPSPPKDVFNVERVFSISGATQNTNQAYHAEFSEGSRWRYYNLVMTQWSINNPQPSQVGDTAYTFPGSGATTAFDNSVMETFFQRHVEMSCLPCHAIVAGGADLVWSLKAETRGFHSPEFRLLEQTLKNAGVFVAK